MIRTLFRRYRFKKQSRKRNRSSGIRDCGRLQRREISEAMFGFLGQSDVDKHRNYCGQRCLDRQQRSSHQRLQIIMSKSPSYQL